MQRRKLLQQLDHYRKHHPAEATTVERFVNFVRTNKRCFERDCWNGHITGSAWLLDPTQRSLLLTHHRKLDLWLQLGGHSDGHHDTMAVAQREAEEESGLSVTQVSPHIFDIDVHEIPARRSDPAHYHFDVRFCFVASQTQFTVSAESIDLAWVELDQLERYTNENSILRMRDKWYATAK